MRFLVAGSGTHEEELREQARRLGLLEHGAFLGWIGDDALHSLYRIADLCVVPSIYEPFGLVALEAMASGCPCIVADTGGLREVVPAGERVGLRFNGGDAAHLGVMIERLLTDGELRERLVAGGLRARAELRLERRGAPHARGLPGADREPAGGPKPGDACLRAKRGDARLRRESRVRPASPFRPKWGDARLRRESPVRPARVMCAEPF